MNLVIIPELLNLTSGLARALTQPAGCAFLAGRSGVGRRSALRIISSLQGAKLVSPAFGNLTQFKTDLKLVCNYENINMNEYRSMFTLFFRLYSLQVLKENMYIY